MVDYLRLPGETVPPPPYLHTGATMHALLFNADRAVLQALVNTTLNRVPDMQFDVVSGTFLFISLYVDKATSTAPGYENRGTASETDVGFWILLRGGRKGQPRRLRWFPLYLFVDSGGAMAIGREVFGYPKLIGVAERKAPSDPDEVGMSLTTDYFTHFAPDARPIRAKLFEIVQARDASRPFAEAIVADQMAKALVLHGLIEQFEGDLDLPYLSMPMIFLKQFRAIEDQRKACFLGVSAVSVQTTKLHAMKRITDPITLNFEYAANIPIGSDLGISSGQKALVSFCIQQDFIVGLGEML
jgi:hypothetical protein